MGVILHLTLFLLYITLSLPVWANPTPGEKSGGNIVLYENFENGIPSGWVQEIVNSPDGFPAYWNTRKGAGKISSSIFGDPDTAAVGNSNLVFQFQHTGHSTNLTSKPIDLEFIVNPELTFYHAQNKWGNDGPDILSIHYREGNDGEWILLRRYSNEVVKWTPRVIPLPSGSDKFYLRINGMSRYGMGICIDEFTIIETGIIPRELSRVETSQAATGIVATGMKDYPILKTQVRVTGNTGSLQLESYRALSANTSDSDIASSGVKLYFTEDEIFNKDQLIATTSLENGIANFNNINKELPTGYSYLWLCYDIDSEAQQGNFVDAYIPEGGIVIAGQAVPAEDHNPPGRRTIVKTIFHDDFDSDKGWGLTGEWEIDIPRGLGGSRGFPGADHAFIGEKVLGTDLTGLGVYPGDYEPMLDHLAYQAITPEIDCYYFNGISLAFQEWLNIEFTDKIYIHISTDGGNTWTQIWVNNNFFNSTDWSQRVIPLPLANRRERVKLRFSLGPTDGSNNYSGWNIDHFLLTGNYVTRDVGVAEWLGPIGRCRMTNNEKISVRIKNFGAHSINDPIPVGFSLDGGATWHMDVANQSMASGESIVHTFQPDADFSIPGRYNNVIVKTFLEGDQDNTNDALNHKIFAVPTYTPPYTESFITNDGFWTAYGHESSWQLATPQGAELNSAHAGLQSWITNASGPYKSEEASWIESPCFDFFQMENPVLEFYINTHTPEGTDGAALQYSPDQGLNWYDISMVNESYAWNWHNTETISNLNIAFNQLKGWSGSSSGWKRARVVMDEVVSGEPEVKFRLIFASGLYESGTNPWEGVAFDAFSIYEAPHDLGVTALINPVNTCELSEEQSITIQITNLGFNPIPQGTIVPMGIDVALLPSVYENTVLTFDLEPGQNINYTFDARFDMSAQGNHNITAYTLLPGDTDFYNPGIFNDTLTTVVSVYGYPEISLGDDIYTLQPDTIVLDPGVGFISYLWQDGSTLQTFAVTSNHTLPYHVKVIDNNNCPAFDTLWVITLDLEVLSINEPVNSCELSEEEIISVAIRNNSPDEIPEGTVIPFDLSLNNQWIQSDMWILPSALAPSQTAIYSFPQPVDMTIPGEYSFTIEHGFTDANPTNNTLVSSIFVHGYPHPFNNDTIFNTELIGIVLDPGPEFISYVWQDNSTNQTFTVSNPFNASYTVTLTDQYNCTATDTIYLISQDIEILEFASPDDACLLSDEQTISVKLLNNGPGTFYAGNAFSIVLEKSGTLLAEEIIQIQEDWQIGTELMYEFVYKVDMSIPGVYDLKVYHKYRDAVKTNDEIQTTITVHGYPEVFIPTFIVTDYPHIVVLDPGPGFSSYLWHDNSTSQTYQVSDWGNFWVDVSNGFGCVSRASTLVAPELFDLAVIDILSPSNHCSYSGEQQVRIKIQNSGNSEIPAGSQFSIVFNAADRTINQTFTLNQKLNSGDFHDVTLSETWSVNSPGIYPLTATINFDYDEVPANNSITQQIQVYTLPQPAFAGNVYTLKPDTVTLNLTHVFDSYLWQDGSIQETFSVTSPHTSEYTVIVTDGNGCKNSASVMVVAYDLQLQDIINPRDHCRFSDQENIRLKVFNSGIDNIPAGQAIELGILAESTLMIKESFTLSENWPANTTKEFVFDGKLNLSQKASYKIKAFVSSPNANKLTDTLTVRIEEKGMPMVNLGNDIYTQRVDTVLLDAGPGFYSYLWNNGSGQQTLPITNPGWKWVIVTDQYGCTASDTIFVGIFTDVNMIAENQVYTKIYPNPVSDKINLVLNAFKDEEILMEIYDMHGSLIMREKFWSCGTCTRQTDISSLVSGTYFLRINTRQYQKTHRFTVIQ